VLLGDFSSGNSVGLACWACGLTVVVALTIGQTAGASTASPTLKMSPGGQLRDGESVSISVDANGYFTPYSHVNILECADPAGSPAKLPTSDSTCDGNTIQGNTVLISSNGSFSEPDYTVYLLPSPALGEQSNYQPVCDATNPCVLYVGQNQNDFTAPKVFSAPFTIAAAAGSTSTSSTSSTSSSPATTATSGTTPTVTATTAPNPSVSIASSAAGDTGALANTGPPEQLVWIVISGAGLFLVGSLGRRQVQRARR
jgi:hypothetical protein